MNSFGRIFKVSIFGESHGAALGAVVDGVRAGIKLDAASLEADILRRKSGGKGTTPRIEGDEPEILSGVLEGYTTGAPLAILFRNTNVRSGDYDALKEVPRPGHAERLQRSSRRRPFLRPPDTPARCCGSHCQVADRI